VPSEDGRIVATVTGGAISVPVEAELNGFLRVEYADGQPGWVPASAVTQGRGVRQARIVDELNHMPPELTVATPNLVTREGRLRIQGQARDETRLRDVYIYVGARKVFYHSNEGGSNPREARFDTTVPLRPGINYVVVVARENDQSISRQSFVVRRDGPNGEILETPEHSEEWFQIGVDGAE